MKVTWTDDNTATATMKVKVAFIEGEACGTCIALDNSDLCHELIRNCSYATRHDKKSGNFQEVKE
jgi:hypothetical protein